MYDVGVDTFETMDSRLCREQYNRSRHGQPSCERQSQTSCDASSEPEDFLYLPMASGVLRVATGATDQSDSFLGDDRPGSRVETPGDIEQRVSLRNTQGSPPLQRQKSRGKSLRESSVQFSSVAGAVRLAASVKGRKRSSVRLQRRDSGSEMTSGLEADRGSCSQQSIVISRMMQKTDDDGNRIGRRDKDVQLEPWAMDHHVIVEFNRDAEDAKARATHTARAQEERYAAEIQVRHMWRTMMGPSPGLPAEIAKMRATEQAKHRLREYELEWELRHGRSMQSLSRNVYYTHEDSRIEKPPVLERANTMSPGSWAATFDFLVGVRSRPSWLTLPTPTLLGNKRQKPADRRSSGSPYKLRSRTQSFVGPR